MSKLEQIRESLRAKFQKFHEEVEVPMSIKAQGFKEFEEYVMKKEIEFLNSLITEVWYEAIKECEGNKILPHRLYETEAFVPIPKNIEKLHIEREGQIFKLDLPRADITSDQ